MSEDKSLNELWVLLRPLTNALQTAAMEYAARGGPIEAGAELDAMNELMTKIHNILTMIKDRMEATR